MIFKGHESIMMCDKCYGLIKDKIGAIHLKYNNNVKICNCKECRRSFAIDIDKNIFDIVQTLNLKGYKTSGSCEGVGHRGLYVAFDKLGKDVKIKTKGLPNGFVLNKSMLYSTKEYNTPKEKKEDYKKLLDWINDNLVDIKEGD